MLSADQIRNVEFSRGRGYRAEEVDDFIDACTETVEQLQRENEEISQKMKVLAEKLVEYRNDEDSIRAALLNAQRAGDAAKREAEEQAAKILKEAQQEAENQRIIALGKIEAEKRELEHIQQEVTAFKARLMAMYKEHLEMIGMLPEEKKPEPQPVPQPEPEPQPASIEETDEDADMIVVPDDGEIVAPGAEEEDKPASRFADLKFGEDYDISADTDEDEPEEDVKPRGFFKRRK